jgi:p-aminobenzoyl-glutamate transporter AbgT
LDQKRQAKADAVACVFRQKKRASKVDFYTITIATAMTVATVCIACIYLLIKRDPDRLIFSKPVPSNLMPILIVLFLVAGVVAVVFKPVQPPQYIVIEPSGEVTKIY